MLNRMNGDNFTVAFLKEYLLTLCLDQALSQYQDRAESSRWTCHCVGVSLALKHSFLEEVGWLRGSWDFQETHRGHKDSFSRFYSTGE